MSKRFYVYALQDPKNGDAYYIGKGCGGRAKRHFTESGVGYNPHKDNIIKKRRREGYTPKEHIRIVSDGLTEEEAWDLEHLLINEMFDQLTNLNRSWGEGADSGEDNPMYGKTEENNRFAGCQHSDSTKQKLSEINRGKKNPMYGSTRNHSRVARQKMSESTAGKNHPMFGKEHSEETKRKMSKVKRGENNPRNNLSKHEAKEIKWLVLNSNLIQQQIGKEYGVCQKSVSHIKNEDTWEHIDPERPEDF